METDTAIDAKAQLELLRAELVERGWIAQLGGTSVRPYLRVVNPHVPALNGMVACRDDQYRWSWGPLLGAADDVPAAARRIQYVLRAVGP